ncbi:hypothetical protein KJY73_14765 [Bowmanella sp. Y26]|uniref:hypothetical protein n=1 Tax=Bowmanella yangjiangensis TaxID=2811230 RepID=UPI001BDBE39D|nr:hypothetical protein [Bowmanella yangjiangensis]MBT1064852.1 hypothetical protein [Bowmanella yangjiangensis]
MTISGHFVPTTDGYLFATQFGPMSKHAILILPPLFEEMNLSRAVIAKQAQVLASRGMGCVLMDYYGTGDSEGELSEGCALRWREDVVAVGQWMMAQGMETLTLWGVRFGALLQLDGQTELVKQLPVTRQLVWKPITSGKTLVNQLLRLKVTNQALAGNAEKVDWRGKIRQGESVEIAGYLLSETLVASLEAMQIPMDEPLSSLCWHELGSTTLLPAVDKYRLAWPTHQFFALPSKPFWQSPEIFDEPDLNEAVLKGIGCNA